MFGGLRGGDPLTHGCKLSFQSVSAFAQRLLNVSFFPNETRASKMPAELYRYDFDESVPIEDIEASLVLAVMGTESLHGEAQVRLDAAHFLDSDRRRCVIDAGTSVGRDFNRLFIGYVRREFGDDAFKIRRLVGGSEKTGGEVAA